MDSNTLKSLGRLIRDQRVAGLGSLRDGAPQVTLVSYAVEPELGAFYFYLSSLARHTRAVESDPRAGLLISEPDPGNGDPQRLARVSIQGSIHRLAASDPRIPEAQESYLGRFPDAKRLLKLGDFAFYRLEPEKGRYVAGFAQAYNIGPLDLSQAAAASGFSGTVGDVGGES